MNRAIVLIGVAKTGGGLALLQSVEDSLNAVELWARNQKIPGNRILRFSDNLGASKVEPGPILQGIRKLAELATIEQLIVYFSGHGIVNNRQEYWLLSDAPEDSNAAVNLVGSMALAEGGAFPHVVIISDACRSQAPGVQSGNIRGFDIFPNIMDTQQSRSVDVFYATSLGAPALEVTVSAEQGPKYQSVYSDAMVDALNGRVHEAVDEGFVRPHPLKKHLPAVVQKRLLDLNLSVLASQVPDARITSDPDVAWISKVDTPAPLAPGAAGPSRSGAGPDPVITSSGRPPRPPLPPAPIQTPESNTKQLVSDAIQGRASLTSMSEIELEPLGIDFAMTGSSIDPAIVHGSTTIGSAIAVDGNEIKALHGDSYVQIAPRMVHLGRSVQPQQVLLEMADGSSLMIPIFAGFAVVVRFRGSVLSDISFIEPRALHDDSARNLRELRDIIAAASARGLFALERDDASALARRMQDSKFHDPAMALFAAYAYQELGLVDSIRQMQGFLRGQFGAGLFDLELLGRGFLVANNPGDSRILPSAPLLSQGWAFAAALGGPHAERLQSLRPHLLPSIWTHFSPEGTELLRREFSRESDPDPAFAHTEATP